MFLGCGDQWEIGLFNLDLKFQVGICSDMDGS